MAWVAFGVGVAAGLGAGYVVTLRFYDWSEPVADLMRQACAR